MLSTRSNNNNGNHTNVVPPDEDGELFPITIGSLVKEIGHKSKGRWGLVRDTSNNFAWIEMDDGHMFKKGKMNLVVTTCTELSDDRFAEADIAFGTLIECIGGTNAGLKGRVVAVTACFYRFRDDENKPRMVSKANARDLVEFPPSEKKRKRSRHA